MQNFATFAVFATFCNFWYEIQHFATFYSKCSTWHFLRIEQPFTGVSLAVLTVSEDVKSVKIYLEKRLQENSGLQGIVGLTRKDIALSLCTSLQQCTATSVSLERSFSFLKKLLAEDRDFCDDNVEKHLIKLYNYSVT